MSTENRIAFVEGIAKVAPAFTKAALAAAEPEKANRDGNGELKKIDETKENELPTENDPPIKEGSATAEEGQEATEEQEP
jgi:hypothetical protein